MILGVMVSVGILGMVGFIFEFLVFRGSFNVFRVLILLCMIGIGLILVYFLFLINWVFFGRLFEIVINLFLVKWFDRILVIILVVMIVVLGV